MHRHGGAPLLRPELAAMYDAFETPRAVARRPAAARPRRRARLPRRRARARAGRARRRAPIPSSTRWCSSTSMQHGETMLQAIELARLDARPRARAARPRPAAPERHTGLESVEVPGGPCTLGAPAGVFSYDNERPRHGARPARLPHRPHADHQRDVPDASSRAAATSAASGGRTRAGPGRSDYDITHPGAGPAGPSGWQQWRIDGWAPLRPRRARGPRLLVRGRRLRQSTRRSPPYRGRVGEGGDLGPGTSTGAALPVGLASLRGTATAAPTSTRRARPVPAGALPAGAVAVRRARHARRRLGVDRERLPTATPASSPTRTASTPRSSSATATRCCAAARGPRARASPTPTFRNWDLPQRRQIFSGVQAGMGRVSRRHPDRLPPRPGRAALAGRRRARRPHAAVQGAAAQALLRRARLGAVRRICELPEYYPTRTERAILDARGRRDRGRAPARPSWSSSAPAPRPRRACCSTPWRRPARCAATCRSTSPSSVVRDCAAALADEYPGLELARHRRRLRAPPRRDPAAAARAAAHRRLPRRHDRQLHARQPAALPARAGARCSAPATTCCSAPTSSRTSTSLEAAYDDSAGVTAEFNRNMLRVLNRELDADFAARAVRPRRVLRPRARVDRDAPARPPRVPRADRRARPRDLVPARRGAAHGDLGQVHARAAGGRLRGGGAGSWRAGSPTRRSCSR